MSSLKRYRKSGGFVQLLSLIETFVGPKKAKFIDMIEGEDPAWAKMLSEKMLTLERIYAWPDQVLIEVLKHLQPSQLAWVMEGFDQTMKDRMHPFFSGSERRKLDDIIESVKVRRPEDILSNQMRMIELTRKLLLEGTLRPEKFDPGLVIPESVEARLDEIATKRKTNSDTGLDHHVYGEDPVAGEAEHAVVANAADLMALKKTIAVLVKKNQELNAELRVLRDKLDHIRKVA